MPHPAQLPIDELLADCQVTRTRRSGPGGQHRNKVETAIVLEHRPSGISAEASERRSQEQNRQQAVSRLRVKLAIVVRTEPAPSPSALWQQRRSGQRIAVSSQHEDFPALLAESLDVLHEENYLVPQTAARLGITASQLVKLWKIDHAALAAVNRQRQSRDESVLR